MKGAPRSDHFDDIYFSATDGLAETQHIFIEGNNLPAAWQGAGQNKKSFTICETGFGTGLNFLAVWKLFEETMQAGQTLDFISFEKYPLTPSKIKDALAPWAAHFGSRIEILCNDYPLRIAGFHRIKISPHITLTLIFDDMNDAIPQLNAVVDCWFLDGFTPAKNPDMWTDTLFQNMERLSASKASFATFTVAGSVRRGLEATRFNVQKDKGFGHKRDMMKGHFEGQGMPQSSYYGKRIAIIGGGLAGTACAYTLKQYGFDPVIYEREEALATGASGNSLGMFNPRFCAQRDEFSEFFVPAYDQLIRLARKAGAAIDYNPCGALHIINSPEKEKRFRSLMVKWMWHNDHISILNAEEASNIAGISINKECLYLPDSGSLSPHKLCHYLARDIEVRTVSPIGSLDEVEADAVILCNAHAAKEFIDWLPLVKVRGQITEIETPSMFQNLKMNIHYGGYVSATQGSANIIGATFEKWIDHEKVTEKGHDENITNLINAFPSLKKSSLKIKGGRARFRTEPHDHFPLVGQVTDEGKPIFMATAFGSHGIVGTIQSAHYVADLLRGGPACLPSKTIKFLAPQRFLDRMRKKQAK